MIHLITYGCDKYEKSKNLLYNEALTTNWFNSISVYGPNDLDNEFKTRFKDILNQPRGSGYWIWKVYIINKKLNEIKDGDILIYLDAGCTINKKGERRFYEYIDLLNNNNNNNEGIISFSMPLAEKAWTTKEIFNYFNVSTNSEIANSGQLHSTILIMKKNNKLINIINNYYKLLYTNPLLFTDYYNNNQQPYFIDNRHDQSIFSILRKIYGSIILNDETWFQPFGSNYSLAYPFWGTRRREM
jgi:hypothetical protein